VKKTTVIAIVGAITLLLAACNNVTGPKSKSGRFTRNTISYECTFVPVEIQVSNPFQDTAKSANGFKTVMYRATIYFIDSVRQEYSINLSAYMEADFTGKFSKEDLKAFNDTKKFFKKMTMVNPLTLYLHYDGKGPTSCLYVHKQIVNSEKPIKYFNNAKIKEEKSFEEDKSIIWKSTSIVVPTIEITATDDDGAEG